MSASESLQVQEDPVLISTVHGALAQKTLKSAHLFEHRGPVDTTPTTHGGELEREAVAGSTEEELGRGTAQNSERRE